MPVFIELLKSMLYGIVEGITEWLPVSSTGHLILLDEFIALKVAPELGKTFADEYMSMFEVVIQLGAILAVVVMFFNKLNPFAPSKNAIEKKQTWSLWFKVAVASIPAASMLVIDKLLIERHTGKDIDGWLYDAVPVAVALIVYGVLFIIVEKWQANKPIQVADVHHISYAQAVLIGFFQALAVVPGTSRSGSTILGARILGIGRPAAAEFSFFMGIPAMFGASIYKTYSFFDYVGENCINVPWLAWAVLAVASATAFLVSLAAIRFLMDFVKKHSFASFGWYRIALGGLVLGYFMMFGR